MKENCATNNYIINYRFQKHMIINENKTKNLIRGNDYEDSCKEIKDY